MTRTRWVSGRTTGRVCDATILAILCSGLGRNGNCTAVAVLVVDVPCVGFSA